MEAKKRVSSYRLEFDVNKKLKIVEKPDHSKPSSLPSLNSFRQTALKADQDVIDSSQVLNRPLYSPYNINSKNLIHSEQSINLNPFNTLRNECTQAHSRQTTPKGIGIVPNHGISRVLSLKNSVATSSNADICSTITKAQSMDSIVQNVDMINDLKTTSVISSPINSELNCVSKNLSNRRSKVKSTLQGENHSKKLQTRDNVKSNDLQAIVNPANEIRVTMNAKRRNLNKRRHDKSGALNQVDLDDFLNNVQEHYGGKMNESCGHCSALHFKCEKVKYKPGSFDDCCNHGKVKLEPLPELPEELNSLFQGNHTKSKHFFERIRAYNSSLAFASFNANLRDFSTRRPGPYCFVIQGQIYYQMSTTLEPPVGEKPCFGQLFVIDSSEAIGTLLSVNSSLDPELLKTLDSIIRENNVFVETLAMMKDELEAQKQSHSSVPNELFLSFTSKPGLDPNRYNIQRFNEVAVIFSTTDSGEIPNNSVIIRNKATKKLQSVSSMHQYVEPWIYPLFYPFGTKGWSTDLKHIHDPKKVVSRRRYTQYRMAIRENENNPILRGRRLLQQWLVDQYVKMERDRIEFIKSNQTKLRAENYAGVVDYLRTAAEQAQARIGRMIILPSSFTGSPRSMMQHYQDAMAIVRTHGKPDLFITMTCNPKWTEITENLREGEQPSDRPDLTTRVFDMKKKHLMDLIMKEKIFGDVIAYIYSIESQKRGLLHIHLLIILKNKLLTPELVDRFIWAEIPDCDKYPVLHNIVRKNMIHGPCGDWCKVNGKCSKKFPKKFREQTIMDENGYPNYRRRNTGLCYDGLRGHAVDNRWVVPYSPKLSLILNCHINVEAVTSCSAPKYMFKYVLKASDAAAVDIVSGSSVSTSNDQINNPTRTEENSASTENHSAIDHDEVKDFIDARYVGPNEAMWRILGNEMQAKSHAVIRLGIHLPNQQTIMMAEDLNEQTIRQAMTQSSMLLEYFKLNSRDENSRQYIYSQIPTYYTWTNRTWKPRQRNLTFSTIGRMYSVNPSQVELFHLRLLLLYVKGAKSFDELKTVDGIRYDTFVDACVAHGFVENDHEWEKALTEATVWMMPQSLRRLFVRILVHCNPLYPESLWDQFKLHLSEDYTRKMSVEAACRKAYGEVVKMLEQEGSHISKFPRMPMIEIPDEDDELHMRVAHHLEIGQQQYGILNATQKKIVDTILNAIEDINDNRRNCFYVDGPGGSGKTFMYTTLYHLLKGKKKRVSTMAYTGIAATLLPEGKTAHKTFSLPFVLDSESTSTMNIRSKKANVLRNADLLIWDEAPMAPRYALEVANRLLQDIMNNDKPFGGKMIILGGDFRQLLPVKLHGTRTEIVSLSIKYSNLWSYFVQYSLTQNMRALPQEVEFTKFLLDVGSGNSNDSNHDIEMPDHCIAPPGANIAKDTYGELIRAKKYKDFTKCAILAPRNVDVNEINDQVIDLLDEATERIYTGVDSTENCDNDQMTNDIVPEYLNTLSPTSLAPYELRLRKFSIVMLIRNLSIDEGLCNGTRLLVLQLCNNVLKCEILTGDKAGDIVFLNRITLYSVDDFPFSFKRRQFPIRVAFAMTINKSQGQTFDRIAIDLRRDVFNHGQLYVALSRVRSWDAVKVYTSTDSVRTHVKNYVYKEILM